MSCVLPCCLHRLGDAEVYKAAPLIIIIIAPAAFADTTIAIESARACGGEALALARLQFVARDYSDPSKFIESVWDDLKERPPHIQTKALELARLAYNGKDDGDLARKHLDACLNSSSQAVAAAR